MTADSCFGSEEPMGNGAQVAKARKKRKWDQPAESLLSAGLAVGMLPVGSLGNVAGINLLGVSPICGTLLVNTLTATGTTMSPVIQAPTVQKDAAAIIPKLNQPKIQDELIAREIVINDAEPSIRYKLTKRQTQEEIQRSTGAVVITRGKYRPPNGLPDNEKPLYLHISAGAHLKDTVERIKAVDRAAAIVDEIIKQGQNPQSMLTPLSVMNNGHQVVQPLTACVFLGFEPDPALMIANRIRGPNDQYINHIMNETGATVVLKGRGSENIESPHGTEVQQPLHLFLSSNNSKNLEAAKLLAENLLDTISVECGASRVSSSRVYGAVPPPEQLLSGISSSAEEHTMHGSTPANFAAINIVPPPSPATLPTTLSSTPLIAPSTASANWPQVTAAHNSLLTTHGQPHISSTAFPHLLPKGTSYSGYGGIYPQATPLQQVALALKQASPATSISSTPVSSTLPKTSSSLTISTAETDKRSSHRRKFQELPVALKGITSADQNLRPGSEFLKPGFESGDGSMRNVSNRPPPKKLVQTDLTGMVPSLPIGMPPPPPSKFVSSPPSKFASAAPSTPSTFTSPSPPFPPKFTSPAPPPVPKFKVLSPRKPEKADEKKLVATAVSDIFTKLAEYGDDEDEDEENAE